MRIMFNLFILSIITMSAFSVIYIKHKNRFMNIDIEKTEKKLSYELNKHKKLLDIRSQLIEKRLINTDIKKSLGMEIPDKNKIIYLDLVE